MDFLTSTGALDYQLLITCLILLLALLLLLRRLYLLLRGRAGGCRGCPEEKKNNHCRGNSCP